MAQSDTLQENSTGVWLYADRLQSGSQRPVMNKPGNHFYQSEKTWGGATWPALWSRPIRIPQIFTPQDLLRLQVGTFGKLSR